MEIQFNKQPCMHFSVLGRTKKARAITETTVTRARTRLIFYKVPDVAKRNIQRFGRTLIIYPRWIETGYENELMRLTDFMNSLPIKHACRVLLPPQILFEHN